MYNVLLEEQKKNLKQEYRLRLATVTLFLLAAVFVSGIIALIPEVTLTFYNKATIEQELKALKEGNEGKLRSTYVSSIKEIETQVKALDYLSKADSPHSLIDRITQNRGKGVTLTKFSYRIVGTTTPMTLVGAAERLEDLLKFQERMQKTKPFTVAEFPIDLLSKSKNSAVSFSLQIK